jgi:hypothetical protein
MPTATKKSKQRKGESKTRKLNKKLDKLNKMYEENKCDVDIYSDTCNTILLEKEGIEVAMLEETPNSNGELYPTLNDPMFSEKIASKKEFHDTRYDGTVYEDIEKHSNSLIQEGFHTLQPHQSFVKNFLSFQTPFNSLLLYHGLGSGKTCSAIGVCEEYRDYLNQTGGTKKIMIVAAPNVIDNFKKQLFDETKLVENSGLWSISSCIGNKLVNEVNPTNIRHIPKERLILQIKSLIKTHYVFMGYIEFANYIEAISGKTDNKTKSLQAEFNDRLLVIDEIHNIRVSDQDTKNKLVADKLLMLISNAERLRLLLLSATPMYNSCTEIVWLLNLLNINDRRPTIKLRKVFNKSGELTQKGEELLKRKMRGYISYVRGENPYTFPFRVFPKEIDPDTIYQSTVQFQMNGKPIRTPTTLDLYASEIGEEQLKGYAYIMDNLKQTEMEIHTEKGSYKMPHFSTLETISYTMLQNPIQALNIVYPSNEKIPEVNLMEFYTPSDVSFKESIEESPDTDEDTESVSNSEEDSSNSRSGGGKGGKSLPLTGINGLMSVVSVENGRYSYVKKHKGFFSRDNIGKYSSKIVKICDHIDNSTGIVLIYSQYIEGGLIPMALALEEMGFTNFSTPLFKTPPQKGKKKPVYAMITGATSNSKEIVNTLTNIENVNGQKIKVILISKSGSEGIDLKYIRQIHIMEPWYNMNRIEQIIGRGVRNGSHKDLPFEQRNVEIYLHSTFIPGVPLELVDEYLYRISEKKAKQIGKITKIMKENAVDCILNEEQLNFVEENFPNTIKLQLSSGKLIEQFQVGDKDYSSQCDYNKCIEPTDHSDIVIRNETYDIKFASEASKYVIDQVKSLMQERHFYTSEKLISELIRVNHFSIEQILVALSYMINEHVPIYDKYNRQGTLVNVGDYYLFQPQEITNKNITTFDRMVPVEQKPSRIEIKMNLQQQQQTNMPQEEVFGKGNEVITELREKYMEIVESAKEKSVRGEKETLKIVGSALHYLAVLVDITSEELVELLIGYLIDYMETSKLIEVLNFFAEQSTVITDDFLRKINDYLTTKIIPGNPPFVCLYDKNVVKIVMFNNESRRWEINTESVVIKDSIQQFNVYHKEKHNVPLNPVIGFLEHDDTTGLTFKTKEITKTRNAGAKCANAGKVKTIKQLNLLVGQNMFTPDNTKMISQQVLCIMQEFIMRHFNRVRPSHTWFLTQEEEKILKR